MAPEARQQRDVTELARIKRQYALLQEEHELLRKAIRFWSAQRQKHDSYSVVKILKHLIAQQRTPGPHAAA